MNIPWISKNIDGWSISIYGAAMGYFKALRVFFAVASVSPRRCNLIFVAICWHLPARGIKAGCLNTALFLTIRGHAFSYQASTVKMFTSPRLIVISPPSLIEILFLFFYQKSIDFLACFQVTKLRLLQGNKRTQLASVTSCLPILYVCRRRNSVSRRRRRQGTCGRRSAPPSAAGVASRRLRERGHQ